MKDLAECPDDMLALILEKSSSCIDYLGFRLVCSSWRKIIMDRKIRALTEYQIPMLIVPGKKKGVWKVYDPAQNKFLEKLRLKISNDMSFSGSSAGWLAAVNDDFTITLHKPCFGVGVVGRNQTVCLPSLFPPDMTYLENHPISWGRRCVLYEREYHVKKILVTADPVLNPKECVIVAIFGQDSELAFIRYAKDTSWTKVELSDEFHDVMCHKNRIYAVTCFNKLVCFDVPKAGGNPLAITILTPSLDAHPCMVKRYLVKTPKGDLLQVARSKTYDEICWTLEFDVMTLDAGDCTWTKVESLGDVAVFLGDNTSVAVKASDFNGCQSDSIYFNQDKDEMGDIHHFGDLGVYEVGKKKFNSYFNIDWSTLFRMPKRPLWILPFNIH